MAIPFVRDFDPAYGEAVSVAPGLQRVVARNPGPFTFAGTGVYIIGGARCAVIDPGPDVPAHREALWRALAGRRVDAVLLTHHHLDHTPLARPLADAHSCPVVGMGVNSAPAFESEGDAALSDTALDEGVDTGLFVDVEAGDGWEMRLPGTDHPNITLRALHTPGHTSNHLCWEWVEAHALFTGDHIMGWSTTVVVPPDGRMADYMASLQRVMEWAPGRDRAALYPTHGAPIAEPAPFLAAYHAHRLGREAKVVAALRELGAATVRALVEVVYADTNPALWPAAAQSLLAHLIWLEEKGEAVRESVREGETWRLARLAL